MGVLTERDDLLKSIEEGQKKASEEYLAAVKKNGQALQSIPEAMKTETLCLAAVQQDGKALRYVPEALKTEPYAWLLWSNVVCRRFIMCLQHWQRKIFAKKRQTYLRQTY